MLLVLSSPSYPSLMQSFPLKFLCAVQGQGELTNGCTNQKPKDYIVQDSSILHPEKLLRRKLVLSVLVSTAVFPTLSSYAKTKNMNPYNEKKVLQQNKQIQKQNNAPDDFPSFIREGNNHCFMYASRDGYKGNKFYRVSLEKLISLFGPGPTTFWIRPCFEVKVIVPDNYIKRDSGLFYRDFEVGKGDCPKDGQQVTFHYVGYNESGRRIDSTYLQGSPAKIRMGNKALVPGFEEGISDMRAGGKRRIIIPPDLGPPVGPSTFFSSKQFEVFDIELLSIQSCERRTIGFYSDVVCN